MIPINAVQFTLTVAVKPRLRSPKSTGELQLRGSDTGEPRQIKFDLASDFGLISQGPKWQNSLTRNIESAITKSWSLEFVNPTCGRDVDFDQLPIRTWNSFVCF